MRYLDRYRRHLGRCTCCLSLVLFWLGAGLASYSQERPLNVLFIAVDDLRPELGCYGKTYIHSPNIDRLAQRGVMFSRAYCQQPLCNPSRSSVMTGLRPDTLGVVGNHVDFRDRRPDVVTLPQFFKQRGFRSIGIGKIYHGPFETTEFQKGWDCFDDPESWSEPAIRFGPRYYFTDEGMDQAKAQYEAYYRRAFPDTRTNPEPDEWTRKLVFGPMTEAPDVPDSWTYDGRVASTAVQKLKEFSRQDQPFFLGVGFIKPHTPFVAPKKYWDLYERGSLPEIENALFPSDAPKLAFHNSGEIRRYTDQPNRGDFSDENRRQLRHGYFACISYIDAQIGRVLDTLEETGLADSTLVVLWGDHGYHLGEQNMWGKISCFENAARVPLVICGPEIRGGRQCDALVELVDLFPTLIDLTSFDQPTNLEGQTLKPLLKDPEQSWSPAAYTQQPRGGNWDRGGKTMGYSLRTEHYRFTRWIEVATGEVVATECYDHRTDPHESKNIAIDDLPQADLEKLVDLFDRGWPQAGSAREKDTP